MAGASRDSIRTHNACYDHIDFLTEPVRLARELANSGVYAMKIWPFDDIAKETGGQYITADQMRRGMEPLRLIKEEFGDTMDVAMEFHGYWNLPCAIQIAHALEPYKPMWLEEMLQLVTTTLPVANGVVPLPQGPGLGVELTPHVFARPDVTVERIGE